MFQFIVLLAGLASFAVASPIAEAMSGISYTLLSSSSIISKSLKRIPQPPTAPLISPPFTPRNIKPKKIGYFWAGAGDNLHLDFLAVYSLDDTTFGQLIWLVDAPTAGNSPHHLGASSDGKTIIGGGIFSGLNGNNNTFYFDTTNPYRPTFKKTNAPALSSIADEVRPQPNGGFLITYMGSASAGSPGRVVEVDRKLNIVAEHPQDATSIQNINENNFSPHGLTVDYKKDIMLTSDFIVPASILKPSTQLIKVNTLRLWKYSARKIISTITIPNAGGVEDVRFIPHNKDSAAVTTAVDLGQIWIIYPFLINPLTGTQGVAKLLYDLGLRARNPDSIYQDLSLNGKYLYLTITGANHVAALDISDLKNVKRLDDADEIQPIIGPHYLKVLPNQRQLLVTDYFVQTGNIGLINSPGDGKAILLDILPNGGLCWETRREIDFSREFANRGGAKPHSFVVYDLSDPKKPVYY